MTRIFSIVCTVEGRLLGTPFLFLEEKFCDAFIVISMEEIISVHIYSPIKGPMRTHIFQELFTR